MWSWCTGLALAAVVAVATPVVAEPVARRVTPACDVLGLSGGGEVFDWLGPPPPGSLTACAEAISPPATTASVPPVSFREIAGADACVTTDAVCSD
jgi:hypothetical protein